MVSVPVKLRAIAYHNSGVPVMGITIPEEVAMFFPETSFNVNKSGTSIVLTSGPSNIITKKEIQAFDLESLKI